MADTRTPTHIEDIDRVIHEPVRFGVLNCLFLVESADFLFLMRQLGLTQGNLSSHMTRLEAAGYVSVDKAFENRRPRTLLRLTPAGRQAFESYVAQMKQLLDDIDVPVQRRPRKSLRPAQRAMKPRTT